MSSLDIMLSVRELVETNSCSLSTLAICLDPSGGDDDEGAIDAACTIIEGKEMSETLRPAVRRDRLLMDLLFNQRNCNDINASRCTNLRELLIQSSTPGIVSCGKTLPSCLKTLILDEFGCELGHESLHFNLRTSLTKLVIRCGGTCVAISLNELRAAAPELKSLTLEGFSIPEQPLLPSLDLPSRESPEGLSSMHHLQDLFMMRCQYESLGPLPPSLRRIRVVASNIAETSWLDWQSSKLSSLESIQLEGIECDDINLDILSGAAAMLKASTAVTGEQASFPNHESATNGRMNGRLRALQLAADSIRVSTGIAWSNLFDLLSDHGSNLTELNVSNVASVEQRFISRIISTCPRLESLTIQRTDKLGDLTSECAILNKGFGRLKRLRIWGCLIDRADATALMKVCTAWQVRFEWLPSRASSTPWQAPLYNWRPSVRENVDPFYQDFPEIWDREYAMEYPGLDPIYKA